MSDQCDIFAIVGNDGSAAIETDAYIRRSAGFSKHSSYVLLYR
jgi:hypothetical protein